MREEKIFLEGNRAKSTAAADAEPAEQPVSAFDALSKRFPGLLSDDPTDEEPAEPPADSEEKILLEGNTAGGTAEAGAAAAERNEPPPHAPSQQSSSSSLSSSSPSPIERKIIDEALKKCFDPEIPVNIWELGLIYSVNVSPEGVASVKMTLTAPACPVAGSLPGEVEQKIKAIPGVADAKVELVWEPPWTPEMMSRVARVMLGM
jgi:FeS assembly SUF system protein